MYSLCCCLSVTTYFSEEVSLTFLSLEMQRDISLNIKSNFVLIEGGLCVVFQFLLASSSSSPERTADSISVLQNKLFHFSELRRWHKQNITQSEK